MPLFGDYGEVKKSGLRPGFFFFFLLVYCFLKFYLSIVLLVYYMTSKIILIFYLSIGFRVDFTPKVRYNKTIGKGLNP